MAHLQRGASLDLLAGDLSDAARTDTSDAWLREIAGSPGEAESESQSPHPGQIVDGKYRLGAVLGHGGMGWVFEATHLLTEKQVALKYLKPSLRGAPQWVERFAREARAAGKIDHPNVIRLYDVGGEAQNPYLVMERLLGQTLRERLASGPLSLALTSEIMSGVMRGVIEAHRHGVVHRDLKPENIFLAILPDGTPDQPKVLDFGVSKIVRSFAADVSDGVSASEGFVAGTAHYMSLEQLRGDAIDARADVYALGVMYYEMLSGRRPFEAKSREDLAAKLATEDPAPLDVGDDALSARLHVVLKRALARHAHERFASVLHFSEALDAAIAARPALEALSPPRAGKLRSFVVASCVALLCVVAFVYAGRTRSTSEDRPSAKATPVVHVHAVERVGPTQAVGVDAPAPVAVPAPAPVHERVKKARATPRANTNQDNASRGILLLRKDF